jgi:hypothetical protein
VSLRRTIRRLGQRPEPTAQVNVARATAHGQAATPGRWPIQPLRRAVSQHRPLAPELPAKSDANAYLVVNTGQTLNPP